MSSKRPRPPAPPAEPDLADLQRRGKLLGNVIVAARAWRRAKAARDARAVSDSEKRLLRALQALESCPVFQGRRGRGW
jgi:hypothetical protein